LVLAHGNQSGQPAYPTGLISHRQDNLLQERWR
jgi:hypothetical protein